MVFTFQCNMCNYQSGIATNLLYYTHVTVHHRLSTVFYIQCKVPHCGKTFTTYPSFKTHWYKYRHNRIDENVNRLCNTNQQVQGSLAAEIDCNEGDHHGVEEENYCNPDNQSEPQQEEYESLRHNFGNATLSDNEWLSGTLLFLRHRFNLTFEALEFISCAMEEYCERKARSLEIRLQQVVAHEIRNSAEYRSAFDFAYTDRSIMTRRIMETSWKTTFPTVEPVAVVLNDECPDLEWAEENGEPVIKETQAIGYYIPIIPSLQRLLSVSEVRKLVLKSFENIANQLEESHPKKYSDLWNGEQVKLNSLLMDNKKNSLGIQLFYDDAELGNPLGSKKGKNKLAFFYWTLLNLPPKFRSNLRSIMLLGCLSTDLLKQYGFKKFLQPFIEEMKKLQEGVEFKVGFESTMNLRAFILNVVGDMPASNALAGFKESASATKPCRICLVSKSELDNLDHECLFILREKNSYLKQLCEIMREEDENKKNELTMEYGNNKSLIGENTGMPVFSPINEDQIQYQ